LIESIVNPNLDIESFCEIKAEFLTNKNEIFGFNDTDLKSVEELSKTYPDNKLISLCYGALLGSSLYKIDSATYDDTMRKIESLFTANKEIEQLAIMFAGAAFFRPFHSLNNEIVPINNLNFFENSLQSTVNTFNLSPDILKRINEFFKKSQANYTMQRVYNINNIVLENIDDDKNYENNMAYLNDLNNIYKSHDILSLSLSDILNVAISCLPDDIKRYLPIPATHSFQEPTVATLIDSINKISKTYALFQSNGYIQLYYAYSLYFLILKQNNINNLEALEKMLRLIEDNDDNEFFATIFVGAITFCTQYMNGEKCFYYIDIIDKLYNTYFENEEIKIAYAQTLYFQLFKEDNHNSILKIMKKIERIHEENPVNQILGIIYVQSLFFQVYNLDFKKDTLKTENNLIYDALMDSLNDENQSLDGLLMTQINSLSDNTGDDNIEFLNALSVSLGSDNMKNILNAVFQNANDNIMLFEKAMVCLKSLLKNDSDNTLINILYYSAVNNYVLLQEDRKALLQKEDFFKILINGSPTGELFSQVYLGKLTLLSCDDDNDDNFKIMEIMEYIANIYPKNDMLAMIFAEFLSNLSDSEFLLMKFSPISKIRIIVKRFLSNEDIVRLYLYIIYKMNEYDVEIVQVKEDVNLIAEIMKLHADNGDFIEVCEYMLDILQNEDSFDNELLETNE